VECTAWTLAENKLQCERHTEEYFFAAFQGKVVCKTPSCGSQATNIDSGSVDDKMAKCIGTVKCGGYDAYYVHSHDQRGSRAPPTLSVPVSSIVRNVRSIFAWVVVAKSCP